MNRKNNATYQMLMQVANFATQNVSLFPKTSAAQEILDALQAGIQTLSEEARTIVSADAAIRNGSDQRKAAREKLKTALTAASQIAEALNAGKFEMPAKRSDRSLIDSGRAFSVDAEPMRKEFAKHGIALEAMSAAVEALEQAMLACTDARSKRTAAARKWETALEETLSVVKRYDALFTLTLGDDLAATASYAVARAIPRSGGRKGAAAETPPETVAVASVPAPTPPPVVPPVVVPAA